MAHAWYEKLTGNLEEKRAYRQCMKRVRALPDSYRYAYRRIQRYVYCVGLPDEAALFHAELLELFETSAAQGRAVLDVTGTDVASFCDALMYASAGGISALRKRQNEVMIPRFSKEVQCNAGADQKTGG